MAKGISPVVSIILLLAIVISIAGSSYVFLGGILQSTGQESVESAEHTAEQLSKRFRVEGVDENKVTVRNTGQGDLVNLTFYVGGMLVEVDGPSLATNDVGIYTLNESQLAMLPDDADLVVVGPGGGFKETVTSEENEGGFYSDNLVGYWKFDEGTGTTVGDNSDNNNDAIIDVQRLNIDESITDWVAYGAGGGAELSLETSNKKYGSGGIKITEPTNQWAGIANHIGTIDASQWEQGDNTLKGILHYWLYIDDVSLSYPGQVEFGNANNAYEAKWLSTPVSGSWENGWNLVELDFETATYINLTFIDWTQVDYFEFYLDKNSSTTNYVIFDDFMIHDKASPVWTADGRFGSALSFDGIDDYVAISDDDSLDVTESITMEAWIYPSSIPTDAKILTKDGTYIATLYAPDTFTFSLYINGAWRSFSWAGLAQEDVWQHIRFTYDNVNREGRLYYNGNLQSSIGLPGGWPNYNITTNNNDIAIGAWTGGTQFFFNGTIDEVKIRG